MRFIKKIFSLLLNTFLIISCIPLLFFCAYGLMLGMSPTSIGFENTFLPVVWSSFGIMGILAFFITLFKRPGKILVTFTICGIIAALPVTAISAYFIFKNIAAIDPSTETWAALQDIDWKGLFNEMINRNEDFVRQSAVSLIIFSGLLLTPVLFIAKAAYVLYIAWQEKQFTS